MMKGKYVMVDDMFPVLMPDSMSHDSMCAMRITSAGFFKVYEEECGKLDVCVYGHSESLSLNSDPKDANVIKVFMQMNGGQS